MLRTNLSTRPFYNERAVHALAAAVALAVIAVAAWQIVSVVRLSKSKTEYNAAIRRDKNETEYRTKEAEVIRRGLNQKELAVVAGAAREANQLIERRTFSWTALFNQLESTLPDDVMLTGIHPEFEDGATLVKLEVQGKQSDDIDEFWNRLEKTGSFHDIVWSAVDLADGGLNKMLMTATYTAPRGQGR